MEEDIKILEELKRDILKACECSLASSSDKKQWTKEAQAIQNLINKYKGLEVNNKEQEKIIDLMAKTLLDYANLGVLIKCPAEYDGKYFYKNCKIDVTKRRTNKTHYLCKECVKEYFKKKVKGE